MEDERDIYKVLEERDSLRDQLKESQEHARSFEAEARKIPQHEAEVNRLSQKLEQEQGKHRQTLEKLEEAQRKITGLEQSLRAQTDYEDQIQEQNEVIEHLRDKNSDLSERLSAVTEQKRRAADAHDRAQSEIDRLKGHEEHTKKFAELVDMTKELV